MKNRFASMALFAALAAVPAAGILCGAPAPARAVADYYGSYLADEIYIGRWDPPGTDVEAMYYCATIGGSAIIQQIGTVASGLTNDTVIYGDAGAGGGNDYIKIFRSSQNIPTGLCAGDWNALNYGTKYLDIAGLDGDDILHGGAGNTYASGGNGADYVTTYTANGTAFGNGGNDNLFGQAGAGDNLVGGTENDCLQDGNNSYTTYDCGTGTDRWYHTNTSGTKISCDNVENFCCGFC